MVADTILCNRSDANEIIAEARDEWIISVLIDLGVPENVIEEGFDDESVVAREEYINSMNDLGLAIELYSNGEVDIFKRVWYTDERDEKQIIAQWKTPERILKVDGRDLYYEIHLNKWSTKGMRVQ